MKKKAEPLNELINEHERLVKVLKTPSHKDDLQEAKKQQKELEEYKKQKTQKQASEGKCPPGGCIKQDSSGKWRIISNKTGKDWPQHYESHKSAENALKAYHAHQATIKAIRVLKAIYDARKTLNKVAEDKKKESKPAKVTEIADAIRRDKPGTSDEAAYRMAWETYCSYNNPGYEGCTGKGKSKRESPKPYN